MFTTNEHYYFDSCGKPYFKTCTFFGNMIVVPTGWRWWKLITELLSKNDSSLEMFIAYAFDLGDYAHDPGHRLREEQKIKEKIIRFSNLDDREKQVVMATSQKPPSRFKDL